MLVKESLESPPKEGYTRISNDIVLNNETLERIRWTSGAMYGGKIFSTFLPHLTDRLHFYYSRWRNCKRSCK
jgi:hypothetical protein